MAERSGFKPTLIERLNPLSRCRIKGDTFNPYQQAGVTPSIAKDKGPGPRVTLVDKIDPVRGKKAKPKRKLDPARVQTANREFWKMHNLPEGRMIKAGESQYIRDWNKLYDAAGKPASQPSPAPAPVTPAPAKAPAPEKAPGEPAALADAAPAAPSGDGGVRS